MNEELPELEDSTEENAVLYGGPFDGLGIPPHPMGGEILYYGHSYHWCAWMTARLRKPTFISEHLHLQFF